MTRFESPLGIRRQTLVGAIAGLGAALALVGGSLSGLSDDILDFRGWSDPSVADRGGAVGLSAEQRGPVPARRTGPAPAQTAIEIAAVARALRADAGAPQRASARRTRSRPDARTRRGGGPTAPGAPEAVAQTPAAAAPVAAPAPAAPVAAPAQPVQVAVVPERDEATPARRTAEPTRTVGNSGKVKPVKKKDATRVSTTEAPARVDGTGAAAPEPIASPVTGRGPDGQGAPGQQRKASSTGRDKHDRDHHGLGHLRGAGSQKH